MIKGILLRFIKKKQPNQFVFRNSEREVFLQQSSYGNNVKQVSDILQNKGV